jgi:hypothetical protein
VVNKPAPQPPLTVSPSRPVSAVTSPDRSEPNVPLVRLVNSKRIVLHFEVKDAVILDQDGVAHFQRRFGGDGCSAIAAAHGTPRQGKAFWAPGHGVVP